MGMVLLLCMMGPPPHWRAHLQSIQEPLPSEQSRSCCIRSDGEAGARMLRVFAVAGEGRRSWSWSWSTVVVDGRGRRSRLEPCRDSRLSRALLLADARELHDVGEILG